MLDEPKILDKGCYWILCVPVNPDKVGWKWKGIIWVKGRDEHFTQMFKRSIEDIEARAAEIMSCKDSA